MDDTTRMQIHLYFLTDESEEGSEEKFVKLLEQGQRIGQALFNALSRRDQNLLRGTLKDPFNYDGDAAISMIAPALMYLMEAHWYKAKATEVTPYYGD